MKHRLINRNQEEWLNVARVQKFYIKDNHSSKIVISKNMTFLASLKKCLVPLTELFLE